MELSAIAPPNLDELTKCSFCRLRFNDTDAIPKLFACSHYFCLNCVNSLLHEQSEDVVCVNCWQRTPLPGPEPKSENLPNHNGILNLIQHFNALSGNKTTNNRRGNINTFNRNEEHYFDNETDLLTNNFGFLNSETSKFMENNFNEGGYGGGGATSGGNYTNSENVCVIDMGEKERSPSIASSSGGSIASSITLGGNFVAYNGTCNNSSSNNYANTNKNNNNNNNNYPASCSNINNNAATICINLKVGENCMTHAMPNNLWCSTCSIQLCRACAGSEEHRMHPVRNQIEAKESLHNDISNELQSMHKTLNDVQQLLLKQRDFRVKILESCTTLKSQIESELISQLPTVEIAEMRESLLKAGLCLELLDKQTPGEALKLYTTLHSEKQRLVGKYQEMFLQFKLDELIKSSGFVFDFDLIKQALIQFHSSAVNGNGHNTLNLENNINGISQTHQNPVLLLANYCISQLYSRHMLVLKKQQQQQEQTVQQQQHHQGLNIGNPINKQQELNFSNNFHQLHQQNDTQQQTSHHLSNSLHQLQLQNDTQQQTNQHFQNQPTLLPNGFLNTLISNISSNDINSNDDNIAQQTTYAQALQQSTSKAQQQSPIGQRAEAPLAKSYAAIINNANKGNMQASPRQQQQQHRQKSSMLQPNSSKRTQGSEFPALAPIGTRTNRETASTSSSSSASSTTASTLSVQQRSTTHIFARKATTSSRNNLNSLNFDLMHLQHRSVRAQSNNNSANQKQRQHQHQQHQQNQIKPSSLLLNPSVHIYPIYYFNIEIEGKHSGRFLVEVRHDVAPKMAKNFNSLVTQEFGFGYKGCQVFQCWDNESIITGDYELNNGHGGRSVLEEPFFLPEDTKILGIRGTVGMRRSQRRHDNMGLVGSQFRVILREMRGFTGIFGFVIDGLDVIERISKFGDTTGKAQRIVIISSCGKYQ